MAPPRKTVQQYEQEATPSGECLLHPSQGAARKVYILRHGDPRPLVVCHTCDTPACINDSHHFAATSATNTADAIAKGRFSGLRKGGVRFSGGHADGSKKLISRAVAEQWKDPVIRAKRIAGLKAAAARRAQGAKK